MDTAVVLHSGGINSTVAACIAKQECNVALLHVDYGQRAAIRERKCFEDIAQFYQIREAHVTELGCFSDFGGNARCESHLDIEDANASTPGVPPSFVPGLMPTLLGIAVAFAQQKNATRIYIGTSEQPGPPIADDRTPYPDHRREFYQRFSYMIDTALPADTKLKIELPLIDLTRKEIITLGLKLNIPFPRTWSCLRNAEKPCGTCLGCATRVRGFIAAGTIDPLAQGKRAAPRTGKTPAALG